MGQTLAQRGTLLVVGGDRRRRSPRMRSIAPSTSGRSGADASPGVARRPRATARGPRGRPRRRRARPTRPVASSPPPPARGRPPEDVVRHREQDEIGPPRGFDGAHDGHARQVLGGAGGRGRPARHGRHGVAGPLQQDASAVPTRPAPTTATSMRRVSLTREPGDGPGGTRGVLGQAAPPPDARPATTAAAPAWSGRSSRRRRRSRRPVPPRCRRTGERDRHRPWCPEGTDPSRPSTVASTSASSASVVQVRMRLARDRGPVRAAIGVGLVRARARTAPRLRPSPPSGEPARRAGPTSARPTATTSPTGHVRLPVAEEVDAGRPRGRSQLK